MNHKELNNNLLFHTKSFLKGNNIDVLTSADYFRLGTNLIIKDKNALYIVYFYMEYRDDICFFQGFDRFVVYNDLERILFEVLANSDIVGKDYNIIDRPSFFSNETLKLRYELEELSSENVTAISQELIVFYNHNAFPFFEKWHSLYTLYEFIRDKEDREELHPILGQFWQFKKAAILRLCNDERYPDYMNLMYETERKYFEEDPSDIDNVRYFNATKELKEVLDKTQPIYNI